MGSKLYVCFKTTLSPDKGIDYGKSPLVCGREPGFPVEGPRLIAWHIQLKWAGARKVSLCLRIAILKDNIDLDVSVLFYDARQLHMVIDSLPYYLGSVDNIVKQAARVLTEEKWKSKLSLRSGWRKHSGKCCQRNRQPLSKTVDYINS